MAKTDPAVLSLSTAPKIHSNAQTNLYNQKNNMFFLLKNYLGFNFQRRNDIYAKNSFSLAVLAREFVPVT